MLNRLFCSLAPPASRLAALALALAAPLTAQAPAPDSPAIEAKAHELLGKLTLEEKIKLIGGVDEMFTNALPSIGLPRLKMSDASVGVRTWGPTTAYAGGVALAATWDPNFALSLGESLGKDGPRPRRQLPARSRRQHRAHARQRPQPLNICPKTPYLNSKLVYPGSKACSRRA